MNEMPMTWDLTPLAAGDEDAGMEAEQQAVDEAVQKFVQRWEKDDAYLKEIPALKCALDEYEQLMRQFGTGGKSGYYASLRKYQDQNDLNVKALVNQLEQRSLKRGNDLQFFTHRLAKVSEVYQKQVLASSELQAYHHFLERLFVQAKYLLSEGEEKVLRLTSLSAYDRWVDLSSGLFSKETRTISGMENEKAQGFEELQSLTEHVDAGIRAEAGKALQDIFVKQSDVVEAEMNALLLYKKTVDELRGLERPDTSRHLDDDIETDVVDTLISTVSKRQNIAQRFYALKTKLLGMKQLQYYERNLRFGTLPTTYTYPQAVKIVGGALAGLDKEFSQIFQGFVQNGQIDVFPCSGKRGGAYCIHSLITQPTYILLNFTGRLQDVETLAHEVGHGINNELMKSKQNALSFDTPKSTAEVASTFMEDFALDAVMKEASEEQRLAMLMFKLNGDISTIFRQTAFYRFEQQLHALFRKKGAVSQEEVGKLFVQELEAYFGEAVDCSQAGLWWSYVPHFRDFFYVFSYASGLLISKSLQQRVRADASFIQKVKEFLSAGTSASPKDVFARLGMDIEDKAFWNIGLDAVEAQVREAEALAKKLGKI